MAVPQNSPQRSARSSRRGRKGGSSNGDGEPLSLAEELADEADLISDDTDDRYEQIKQGDIHIAQLQRMTMPELIEEARQGNLTDYTGIKKQDLIFNILKER